MTNYTIVFTDEQDAAITALVAKSNQELGETLTVETYLQNRVSQLADDYVGAFKNEEKEILYKAYSAALSPARNKIKTDLGL